MRYYLNKIRTTFEVFRLLLFTIATSFCSYAQEKNDDDLDVLLDDLFFNEQQFLDELIDSGLSYNLMYTSISYNNKTYFSGRDAGIDQFNVVPQISYYHSSGFNASISGIYYNEFDPKWDFTSLSLGYFNTIDKRKNIYYNLGYSKYFYSDGYDAFTNSIDASIGVRTSKRTFGTQLSASYLFGTDSSYQIISSSYLNFILTRKENFAIRCKPRLNFIIAKQSFAIQRIVPVNGQSTLETFNFEVFDLLNTQLNIPISLTTNSWDFELGYNLNVPNAVATETNLKTTNFFHFSVGYLFDLGKK